MSILSVQKAFFTFKNNFRVNIPQFFMLTVCFFHLLTLTFPKTYNVSVHESYTENKRLT